MIIRSGGIIAATWASLMHHGWDGYTEMTKKVVDAGNKVRSRCFVNEMLQPNLHSFIFRAGIGKIEGISVLGDSKLCIVAFTSDRFHVYKVADEMKVSNIHSLFIHIIHKIKNVLFRNTAGCSLASKTPTLFSCTWCPTC